MNKIVYGLSYGDEAKIKVVDSLSDNADIVCRFNGANNCGHTVVVKDKKYVLHTLPSGVLKKNIVSVIGPGVYLDLRDLKQEIKSLTDQGVLISKDNLKISHRCHLITQEHKNLDKGSLSKLIGTTGRGVGFAARDKYTRIGMQLIDLFINSSDKTKEFEDLKEFIKPFICDTQDYLLKAIAENKSIIFEGAQGMMLDLEQGCYPYVTSTSTHPASCAASLGIPIKSLGEIIGVCKGGYLTKVGRGPFPTKLEDTIGEFLQQKGKEFGATTGRKRDTGWLDVVQLKKAVKATGCDYLVMTKLDVLGGLSEVKICIEYTSDNFSEFLDIHTNFTNAKPVYRPLKGWPDSDYSKIRLYKDIPKTMKAYVEVISDEVGCPIKYISLSPERESFIEVTK